MIEREGGFEDKNRTPGKGEFKDISHQVQMGVSLYVRGIALSSVVVGTAVSH